MKIIFLLLFITFADTLSAQYDAIGQLEEISGQKIDRSSVDNSYVPRTYDAAFYDQQFTQYVSELGNKENQQGITQFSKKHYYRALRNFRVASKYLPDNQSIKNNIELAKTAIESAQSSKKIEKLEKEIAILEKKVAQDIQKIKDLGCTATQENFEKWLELSKDGRNEVVMALLEMVVESACYKPELLKETLKTQKYLRTMKKTKYSKDVLPTAEIAKMRAKFIRQEKMVKQFEYLQKKAGVAQGAYQLSKEQYIESVITFSKLVIKNPETKLLITSVGAFAALWNAGFTIPEAKIELATLEAKNKNDLLTLKNTSQRISKNMQALQAKKRALNEF